ncbi:hypothetical protein [uncultured Paraglaciecola sp.]|uniref:hypothetical protein n=1 Tax=uncultured Paraglaciecola sp. TaxID=1765024 RepID=UPI0025D888E0|nr:hypothetical protein [uncultured Paraglaciecola sp.]
MSCRPRGYADWSPQKKAIGIVNQVKDILEEEAEYLPLTIRQIFYRLVARGVIGKDEKSYKSLCECLNKARRASFISFDDIRDDGFSAFNWVGYNNYDQWIRTTIHCAENLELDKQRDQKTRLVVWCEAGGMVPQLERFVKELSIPVVSSGGFDSLSTKKVMASELSRIVTDGQDIRVLHIGDYDPSGVTIFTALAEDVSAFAKADSGVTMSFERIAVLPEHIDEYNLPTSPPKITDVRRQFTDDRTTQCEALKPETLKRILLSAIHRYVDEDTFQDAVFEQREARVDAISTLKQLGFSG